MALSALDKAILEEAREVTGNPKLRNKDIMEWYTGKDSVKPEAGEKAYYLPKLKVSIAVKEVK